MIYTLFISIQNLSNFEVLWCLRQILMSSLSTRVNTKTIFDAPPVYLLFNAIYWYIQPRVFCHLMPFLLYSISLYSLSFIDILMGWVGLWGFLWWAPSAKRKDHHGVSSGWSSVWHCSNTGLSSSQYEQISIILGVWPFCLTPFFFRSITFWWAYGWIIFPLLKLLSFFWLTYYCSIGLCFSVRV